jgi:hypothetical protein
MAAELGRSARDVVCRDYSWAKVAASFEAIYQRIANQSIDYTS